MVIWRQTYGRLLQLMKGSELSDWKHHSTLWQMVAKEGSVLFNDEFNTFYLFIVIWHHMYDKGPL